MARANPLWRQARTDAESVVVFQGAQAYVSPSWYATKADTGQVVPTWNYMVAEARGRIRFIDDAAWLHALVTRLTERHEAGRAAPWAVADAPAGYVAGLLRAIAGLEIELTSLVGKWKLSQNRPAVDRDGVVRGLAERARAAGDAQARAVGEQVAAAANALGGV